MQFFRTVADQNGIIITVVWWVPVLSIIGILLGIALFRFSAIGALPRIFRLFGMGWFGSRFSIYFTIFAMLPAGVLMITSSIYLWASLCYKFQLDQEGIYERRFDRRPMYGTWNKLWSYQIYKDSISLKFFRGTDYFIWQRSFSDDFNFISEFIRKRLDGLDMKTQQSRLLDEVGVHPK